MKIPLHLRSAFTLIELLVVISIIAILAGLAVPVYNNVMLTGRMTAGMNNARQVGFALRAFSADSNGAFPQGENSYDQPINTSNDAFRSLIPAYLDTESIFVVPGSKAGPVADNRISSPSEILERGENHWAYISGLSDTSSSSWPLIVDHTTGSGYYTNRENTFGGTWKGQKTVVIRTDMGADLSVLRGEGEQRYLPRFNDKTKNALEVDYMGDNVKLLEPAR